MKNWGNIREVIQSIKDKRAQQDKLLNILMMYCDVAEQGIDPDDVVSYSFDASNLTILKIREMAKRANIAISGRMFGGTGVKLDYYEAKRLECYFYNVVHLRSGEDVVLQEPILRR